MDPKSQELYQEEQRKALIDLKASVDNLTDVFTNKVSIDVHQPSDFEVTVKNQPEQLKADDLSIIKDWLIDLGKTLTKALEESKQEPIRELTVKNIDQAKQKTVTIDNFSELAANFDKLASAVESIDNKPIVNVQKQELKLPTSPKEAIAVRLSDGKSFYNAIAAAVNSGAQLPYVNQSGQTTLVTLTEDGRIPVEQNGGTAKKKIIDDYTTTNITYIGEAQLGTATSDPHWRIKKIDETLGIIITWTGHGYNATWDDRVTEVYT